MKLSCHNQSDQVQSVMKSSKDNNMIEHIGLIYIEIELLGIIWSGAVYDENLKE